VHKDGRLWGLLMCADAAAVGSRLPARRDVGCRHTGWSSSKGMGRHGAIQGGLSSGISGSGGGSGWQLWRVRLELQAHVHRLHRRDLFWRRHERGAPARVSAGVRLASRVIGGRRRCKPSAQAQGGSVALLGARGPRGARATIAVFKSNAEAFRAQAAADRALSGKAHATSPQSGSIAWINYSGRSDVDQTLASCV
jgi:hypothetical protein